MFALAFLMLFGIGKKYIVDLPYVKDFDEKNIPTKARPVQMNVETIKFCKKEINDLLQNRDIINLSYIEDFPANVLIQEIRMGFCQYFTDDFEGNTYSAKLLTITNYPNILNDSLQELDNAAWINITNKWNNNNNTYTYTTSKWIIMASLAERRNKGKAPA